MGADWNSHRHGEALLKHPVAVDVAVGRCCTVLHHELELLVDLVVLGLCPRSQGRVVCGLTVRIWSVWASGRTALVLLLVEGVDDVLVGQRLVGLVVLGVLEQDLVHVCGRVLVKLVRRAEDDESDLAVAEDAELVGLLHDAKLALVEGHLESEEKEEESDGKCGKLPTSSPGTLGSPVCSSRQ